MTKYCPNGHPMEDWMTECPFCTRAGEGVRKVLGDQTEAETAAKTEAEAMAGLKATVVDGYTEFYETPLKATVVDGVAVKATKVMGADVPAGRKPRQQLPLMGWLVIMNGDRKWQDFRIDTERLTIGQGEECEIRIPDDAVSTRHASLRRAPEGLLLTDLDSTNGTFINNDPDRISRVVLKDEDLIRVGTTYLKFRRL
ncbi:MAG: FHA domain-containing protein [Acidobacteria bacterium]|nr:FHA domain-containing protein [Acidobacteriota bacterium]